MKLTRKPHRDRAFKPGGVMLANRSMGLHYYHDELRCDGGKRHARRRVRAMEANALRDYLLHDLPDDLDLVLTADRPGTLRIVLSR